MDDHNASFLVFTAGAGSRKAVPLELVSRLEVIEASQVEKAGDDFVVQYRDDLMRLKTLPGCSIPTEGEFEAVVFTYDGRTIGLVIDEIIDILIAPTGMKLAGNQEQYLGSAVIDGKTTDVVDVGYLLRDLAGDLSVAEGFRATNQGQRLLVVEDSQFFLNLIVPFLESAGYEVLTATTGVEALGILAKTKVDAIITDIEMPEMDGFELTESLRGNPHYRNLPIIAFTSTVNDASQERGVRAGMSALILKTDRGALLEAVHTHLAKEMA